MKLIKHFPFILAMLLVHSIAKAHNEDLSKVGYKIIEHGKSSLVTVAIILEAGGREREVKNNGVVINKNGLIVTPSINIRRNSRTRTKSLQIIYQDGQTVPGDVVLKDLESGIFFVKPKSSTDNKTFLNTNNLEKDIKILAPIITLGLYEENKARMSFNNLNFFEAEKANKIYFSNVPSGHLIYSTDGKLIGLGATKYINEGQTPLGPYVLPFKNIINMSQQAE